MALVPIAEYEGSLIGNAVLDALMQIGIVDILNKHGYIVNVTGVHGVTPVGMIEDTPAEHKITIVKELRLGNKKDCAFVKKNKVDKDSAAYIESIKELESYKLKLPVRIGVQQTEVSGILIEGNDCYYKHEISINLKQGSQETEEKYLENLFKFTADLLMDSKF